MAGVDGRHRPPGGDRRGLLRPAATPVAAAGTPGRRRGRRGWPVRHRLKPLVGLLWPPPRYGSGISRVQHSRPGTRLSRLPSTRCSPSSWRGEIAPGEDAAVERGRARRAGRGRLTHLPGSPLADRRSGRLCARCRLGCHCRYRHAGRHVTRNRPSEADRSPGPSCGGQGTRRPQSLAPRHERTTWFTPPRVT